MLEQILSAALGEFSRCGFKLIETDDHVLSLLHEDLPVAIFGQQGARIIDIHDECRNHLNKYHGG